MDTFEADSNISDNTPISSSDSTHRCLSPLEFQHTMRFLLHFVKKDKQADSLLERLMVRIGIAQSRKQRRNLAFCISELTISDKGVKKMIELIKHIKGIYLYYVSIYLYI
jgi:condensin complex subunit 1